MTEQNSQHSLSNRFFMKFALRFRRMQTVLIYDSKLGKYQRGTAMSRDHPMSKRTITRLFVGAIVAVAAGLVLAALWAAVASDLVVTVTLAVVGSLAMLAGAVAGVVPWMGLLNTAQLEDKTWFVSLLVLSLFSAGLLAMVAYVLAGPDGRRPGVSSAGIAPALTQQETEMQ